MPSKTISPVQHHAHARSSSPENGPPSRSALRQKGPKCIGYPNGGNLADPFQSGFFAKVLKKSASSHPNNYASPFPGCVGSVDTFPIRVQKKDGYYSGKYKAYVAKVQLTITHMGAGFFSTPPPKAPTPRTVTKEVCYWMVAHISGIYPGAMSDVTIFRQSPPPLVGTQYVLGDKAYISLWRCLPPIKQNNARFTQAERSFWNAIHGHFRARVEQTIGWLKSWAIFRDRWRSASPIALEKAAIVIASLRNLYCFFDLPYQPE